MRGKYALLMLLLLPTLVLGQALTTGRVAGEIKDESGDPMGVSERRYHEHLFEIGAEPARELCRRWLSPAGGRLLDAGGCAGAYTAAFLDGSPSACAVLVDRAQVVTLACENLEAYGDRVELVAGELETVELDAGFPVALMANLLHLHSPEVGRCLIRRVAGALGPGGRTSG